MVLGQPMGHDVATRGHACLERARCSSMARPAAHRWQALHHELSWPTRYLSGKEIRTKTTPRAMMVKKVGSPELGECPNDGS
jgi:hypothetical protein